MEQPNEYAIKCLYLFRDINGEAFKLTPGQIDIFRAVYEPQYLRVAIKAVTQYGKSEVASMALITIAVRRKEKILIVAPSAKQASIIMGKIIEHLFDNSLLTGMIDYSAGTVERLRQERSKNRITFKNGSEIMMLTAEAKYIAKESRGLMGFGATICLPYNQKILTDKGKIKIGDIVKRNLDVKIYSYNHKKRKVELKKIEKYYKSKGRELLEFNFGDRTVRCTEDHPIYVKNKGYILAKDVKEGDKVLCVSD